MVRNVVENHVVTFATFGEILFSVINHVIRAEGSDHIQVPGTAYAGHTCAERLRDLHRERTHTSRCSIDQDVLPWLNFSLVAKSLQRRDACDIDRSCLLKRQAGRLQGHCSTRDSAYILSKSPGSPAEYLIAWFELGDVLADGFNGAGVIDAQSCVLRFSQAHPHC